MPFSIDYFEIFLIALCVGFFIRGARMDMRSPVLWGALSLGLWLFFTRFVMGGLSGGLLSQALLLAGLTVWEEVKERREQARRDAAARLTRDASFAPRQSRSDA